MELITIGITAISMILIVMVPGVFLSLAIFPKKKDLDIVERLGISIVLGLTSPFLLYFGDKNLSMPITAFTSTAAVVLVSLIGLVLWQVRARMGKKDNED